MQIIFKKLIVALVITCLLSACGFHLREAFQLPDELSPVYIKVPRKQRELSKILQEEFRSAKIPLVSWSESASLIIDLRQVSEYEELLTASSTVSPLERELTLKATVYWEDSDGEYLLEPEDFILHRTYVYDETTVLAKSREADSLTRELERELSRRIILRMRQLAK